MLDKIKVKTAIIYRDAKGRFQRAVKAMSESTQKDYKKDNPKWVENADKLKEMAGDTKTADDNLASSHSLISYEENEPFVEEHEHIWKRGILPGGKFVSICSFPGCGKTEEISAEKFQQIPA
jgi:hypothetical protein